MNPFTENPFRVNPLLMNDWPMKRFLAVVLTLQAVLVSLLSLEAAGYGVPVLTQGLGLFFAAFVPGFLVMRILRVHGLSTARTVLYAVGLSVAFLMALGLGINALYPALGMGRPLDKAPFVITLAAVTLVLCGIAWLRDRNHTAPAGLQPHLLLRPVNILLIVLPVMAIIGAQLVNTSRDNTVLMALMLLLALVPVLAMLTRHLPEESYPLAIFSVALALLLHRTLISDYLWGADILGEFACYRTVAMNGVWQPASPNLIPAYNTSLAVTVLPVSFSHLAAIDGLWVFKAVFPALFALVPLAMYEAARTQFPVRTAFLSVFLLMSAYPFFTTFPGVDKQLVATVFLALFLLVTVDRDLTPKTRSSLLVAFGLGVVVTHYSTAFLLALFLPAIMALKAVLSRRGAVLTAGVTGIIVVATVGWYALLADGAVVRQFMGMGGTAVTAATSVMTGDSGFAAESHRLLAEGSANLPPSLRWLFIITQIFMAIGMLVGFTRWLLGRDGSYSDEYMGFAAGFAVLLGLELALPQFSLVISLDRIYAVCLLVLAPFGIEGVGVVGRLARNVKERVTRRRVVTAGMESRPVLAMCAVFLAVFMLANTGFIYELAGQPLPTSIALSSESADFPLFTEGEMAAADWFLKNTPEDGAARLYYDTLSFHLFVYMDDVVGEITGRTAGQILYRQPESPGTIATEVPAGSYIYLRSFNLRTGRLALGWPAYQTMAVQRIEVDKLGPFAEVLAGAEVVYSNADSRIVRTVAPYHAGEEYARHDD